MNRKLITTLAIVGMLGTSILSAQVVPEGRTPLKGVRGETPEGTGIVVYDPGPPADSLIGQTGASATIGNRFSSRNGNPLSPGSVYFLSFYLANASLGARSVQARKCRAKCLHDADHGAVPRTIITARDGEGARKTREGFPE